MKIRQEILDLPFGFNRLHNRARYPGEDYSYHISREQWEKDMEAWKIGQSAVIFKDITVCYDSCSCRDGYPCDHPDYPYAIEFGHNAEDHIQTSFDDQTLSISTVKGEVSIYNINAMTIGDFANMCKVVGIPLEVNEQYLEK